MTNKLNISNLRLQNLKDRNNKLLDRKTQLQNQCRITSSKYNQQMHDITKLVNNETELISNDFISAFRKASQL